MKQKKLLIVAGVLIVCAAAVGLYSLVGAQGESPDDQSLAKPWYCHRCNEGMLLTPAQFESTIGSAVHPAHEGDGGDTRALVMVVQCPKCEGAAVAARQCESHKTIFDPRDGNPAKRRCSDCEPVDSSIQP